MDAKISKVSNFLYIINNLTASRRHSKTGKFLFNYRIKFIPLLLIVIGAENR